MKCYVCYYMDTPEIAKAFWYRKDAIAWVKEDESKREYKQIEIE